MAHRFELRYYVRAGGERIALGTDPERKEDPMRGIQTSAPVDYVEVVAIIDDVTYVGVGDDTKAALRKLAKRLDDAGIKHKLEVPK